MFLVAGDLNGSVRHAVLRVLGRNARKPVCSAHHASQCMLFRIRDEACCGRQPTVGLVPSHVLLIRGLVVPQLLARVDVEIGERVLDILGHTILHHRRCSTPSVLISEPGKSKSSCFLDKMRCGINKSHLHQPKMPFAGILESPRNARIISSVPSSQNRLANKLILVFVNRRGGGAWWHTQSHEPRVFSHAIRSDDEDEAKSRSLSFASSLSVGSEALCRPRALRRMPFSLSMGGRGVGPY